MFIKVWLYLCGLSIGACIKGHTIAAGEDDVKEAGEEDEKTTWK
jgi:hypothetical protein